jgi:hypothetical protein
VEPSLKRAVVLAASVLGIAAAIATGISACASSGGGISGTGFVSGPIQGFGSIFVNGVELDTTDAVVTIEGDPATVDDLELGMFVFVRGRIDRSGTTGTAERIASDHLLLGPVEAVNVAGGTFVSLSQLVITAPDTVFDGTSLATLETGEIVEVFGFPDADGAIRATRVALLDDADEFELTGTIENLDAEAETFQIGLLTVDFSEALIEEAPPEGLSNGLLVEVESEEAPVDDLMLAVGVEVRNAEFEFEEGDDAEVQGIITTVVSADEFVINRAQRVRIVEGTRFEGGTRADVALNARVEIEGALDRDGVLVAEEIEFVSAS